jgi:hypothetical protein
LVGDPGPLVRLSMDRHNSLIGDFWNKIGTKRARAVRSKGKKKVP